MSKQSGAQFAGSDHLYSLLLCLLWAALVQANSSLPTCRSDQYKYDFTECDSFGGRWRVSVPLSPGKCSIGPDAPGPPLRVPKCYSSCEGGQFFNSSSLLCEACPPGHYSLGGGVIIDAFNDTAGHLPAGLHIQTESTRHTPEWDAKCNGWHVDPATKQLVSSLPANPKLSQNDASASTSAFASGCVSVAKLTVNIVKRGRLRFLYHYTIPDDTFASLLFTFNYRLYPSGDSVASEQEGEDSLSPSATFPVPTIEQAFEPIEVVLDRPGTYVFTWRSVNIGNMRGFSPSRLSNREPGTFGPVIGSADETANGGNIFRRRLFSGLIRLKKITIEGVAYASQCTPCEPGTFASKPGASECTLCPPNTANSGFGAQKCNPCNTETEYAPAGSQACRQRPTCGLNDFYTIPEGECDRESGKRKVAVRWIEPRLCIDTLKVFPSQPTTVNCSEVTGGPKAQTCDLGMELGKIDDDREICQFCPKDQYRDEKSSSCQPCPPFTSPFYGLSIFKWNASLPAWSTPPPPHATSTNTTSLQSEDAILGDNAKYLNSFFSRQCIRTEDEGPERDGLTRDNAPTSPQFDDCEGQIAWQPFPDYIRTGASSSLTSYLVLSLTVPGFRSTASSTPSSSGELTFVFETFCAQGDSCTLLFLETKSEESELEELSNKVGGQGFPSKEESRSYRRSSSLLAQQSENSVIHEWTQSTSGRQSYRHKSDQARLPLIYSWVFKRSTSYQSYAKIHSLLLTDSLIGSAIDCKACPFQTLSLSSSLSGSSGSSGCVTCPGGTYLSLEDGEEMTVDHENASTSLVSAPGGTGAGAQCKSCPVNSVLKSSVPLPVGPQSCTPCGPNLITDTPAGDSLCYSNCTVTFDQDTYALPRRLEPLLYSGGNLFTAGGTAYLHTFKLSLCGHPKRDSLATCRNNISSSLTEEASASSGVRSFICRSTMIPDGSRLFATQSISLGDELIGISREGTFANISVHPDFLAGPKLPSSDTDFHLFFSTKTATNACPTGRQTTLTMRCSPEGDLTRPNISTPRSCPDGTCTGCTFHFMVLSPAACRLCRPFSDDFQRLVGECLDGVQEVHFINPKGCILAKNETSGGVLKRPCSVLLPRQIQIGIAFAVGLALILLLLLFHFWNQNRTLEYKYSKLMGADGGGKEDEDGLSFDNCCAEEEDPELESSSQASSAGSQVLFIEGAYAQEDSRHLTRECRAKQKSRLDRKKQFGSAKEMQTLFDVPKTTAGGGRVDEEGYETIHLTSAGGGGQQIV